MPFIKLMEWVLKFARIELKSVNRKKKKNFLILLRNLLLKLKLTKHYSVKWPRKGRKLVIIVAAKESNYQLETQKAS